MTEVLPWLQVLAIVVTAVWAVSRMSSTANTTTLLLGERIASLGRAIDEFKQTVTRVHDDHEERLRNLERDHR